jgi:ubiquitin-conjugating enzyme E2 variant
MRQDPAPRAADVASGPLRLTVGTAIALGAVLGLVHAAHLLGALAPADLPRALAAALLGALAADLLTGLVHWACDTWGDENTPWLGPTLIHAFREHHARPHAMLEHDWVDVNREPGVAAALAWALLALPAVQALLAGRPALYAGLCSFIAYGAAANQLHQWAHMNRPPRWVRAMQRRGLVLSPAGHARHHAGANERAYCISTGWLNPALDACGFWRGLERAVSCCTGATPHAEHGEPGRSASR